jgi:hypothetical protein
MKTIFSLFLITVCLMLKKDTGKLKTKSLLPTTKLHCIKLKSSKKKKETTDYFFLHGSGEKELILN